MNSILINVRSKFTLWTFIIFSLRSYTKLIHNVNFNFTLRVSLINSNLSKRGGNMNLWNVITLTYSLRKIRYHVWLMTDLCSINWAYTHTRHNDGTNSRGEKTSNNSIWKATQTWLAICLINQRLWTVNELYFYVFTGSVNVSCVNFSHQLSSKNKVAR